MSTSTWPGFDESSTAYPASRQTASSSEFAGKVTRILAIAVSERAWSTRLRRDGDCTDAFADCAANFRVRRSAFFACCAVMAAPMGPADAFPLPRPMAWMPAPLSAGWETLEPLERPRKLRMSLLTIRAPSAAPSR